MQEARGKRQMQEARWTPKAGCELPTRRAQIRRQNDLSACLLVGIKLFLGTDIPAAGGWDPQWRGAGEGGAGGGWKPPAAGGWDPRRRGGGGGGGGEGGTEEKAEPSHGVRKNKTPEAPMGFPNR